MTAEPYGPTLPDFVFWELVQESKHEYAYGRIQAFARGTKRHAAITLEVSSFLHANLRESPSRVFGSDVLIVTGHSGRYADVVVTCDERDTLDLAETAVRHPKVIVEVLSESTAAVDRGDKLEVPHDRNLTRVRTDRLAAAMGRDISTLGRGVDRLAPNHER